ncbi:MAG: sugar transferase [Anaerolineae bacterium]|nr:sugar transferase [Gemmatimonadaceae bacterium]
MIHHSAVPIRQRMQAGSAADMREVARPIELVRFADSAKPDRPVVETNPRERSERIDRVVNVALSVAALIIFSPVMLFVALLVKLTSPGPVLYVQTRVGRDRRQSPPNAAYDRRMQDLGGQVFSIYKFRTMHSDAEDVSGAVWASKSDPRVTLVGKFLRKARMDELPQLLNVVQGHMNIVGPRPERPSIFARLREDIVDYPLRQIAKPGITGWAQINQGYDQDLDDVRAKVRYDLEYINRQCLAEDFRIMLKTFPVILFGKGQ